MVNLVAVTRICEFLCMELDKACVIQKCCKLVSLKSLAQFYTMAYFIRHILYCFQFQNYFNFFKVSYFLSKTNVFKWKVVQCLV